MSRRAFLIIAAVVALFVFMRVAGGHKRHPARATSTATPAASKPFPAAEPTVEPERHTVKRGQKPKKQRSSTKVPHEDEDEASNISPPIRRKLGQVVRLYASWPGSTPRSVLLKRLRQAEPFITESAVRKIAAEWHNTPPSFMMVVKGVTQISSLTAAGGNRSKADATVFLNVVRRFKPVNGKAYSQPGVQGYTASMQIIDRQWRVVAIAPSVQSQSSSSGA